MNQHTPGPWTVYGPRQTHVDITVEHIVPEHRDGTERSQFNQGICDLDQFVCRARPDEALANARLIAAAPALLAALEGVMELLTDHGMKCDEACTPNCVASVARAALRAAKGESA